MANAKTLWEPSQSVKETSRIHEFRNWLIEKGVDVGKDYASLWQWSIDKPAEFWELIWEYFQVISHKSYQTVLEGVMPDAHWFNGSTLNFAEHIFRKSTPDHPAIIFQSERDARQEISWETMEQQVGRLASWFDAQGLQPGDCVAAFMPNIPEATFGFLAACSRGLIWSSCSPDFGSDSVLDRFSQIEPRVLMVVDGYQYGGKAFDKMEVVAGIASNLKSVEHVIVVPYLDGLVGTSKIPGAITWDEVMRGPYTPLTFTPVPFDHPIWILYSSGTTGVPKAITHSQGGVLLEHLKYLAFHNDVKPGERFFWFTTTGWMMWNFVQGALLHGATIVLYDGSPGYPSLDVLWELAESAQIEHFGTSAPFLVACMKKGMRPIEEHDLQQLRSVSSTGAPLPPEAFDWVYDNVGKEIWLCSMSGGTDVCTAFVGGCPLLPVKEGEIQCRALGSAVQAFDSSGNPVVEELGEMVITQPMPSMPVFFWNDSDKARYKASYFGDFPDVWRHGDWIRVTEDGGLVIYGRSDATLNRQGVRIGTAEIYRALNDVAEIKDALIVHLDHDGMDHMPLFVVLKTGVELDEELVRRIKGTLRSKYSPRHVPDALYEIAEVPYTISGKKMEAPVKKVLQGADPEKVLNKDAMRNPEAMQFFGALAQFLDTSIG